MLQLGVPKIYDGSSRCAKHTKHPKHANSRESGDMPPQGKLSVGRLNLEAFSVVLAV